MSIKLATFSKNKNNDKYLVVVGSYVSSKGDRDTVAVVRSCVDAYSHLASTGESADCTMRNHNDSPARSHPPRRVSYHESFRLHCDSALLVRQSKEVGNQLESSR